jgi:Flp pilus assembly protein TadD
MGMTTSDFELGTTPRIPLGTAGGKAAKNLADKPSCGLSPPTGRIESRTGSSVARWTPAIAIVLLIALVTLAGPAPRGAHAALEPRLQDALQSHKLKNLDRAIKLYTEVIKEKPQSAEAYNWRGMAYAEKGRLKEAIEDFGQALAVSPEYADAYNNRGEAYRKLGQDKKALRDFQKAISLEPGFAEPHYNMALIQEAQGKQRQAADSYRAYLQAAPRASDKEQVQRKIAALGGKVPGAQKGKPEVKEPRGRRTDRQPPAARQKTDDKPKRERPRRRPPPRTTEAKPGRQMPGMGGISGGEQMPFPMGMDNPQAAQVLMQVMAMGGIMLIVIAVVAWLLPAILFFLIARKTNTSRAWMAFIPIANLFLISDIAGMPLWWPLLVLLGSVAGGVVPAVMPDPTIIQIVGLVSSLISLVWWLLASIGMAKARGKGIIWGILTFLPCTSPIGLIYLAVSK